MCVCVSNSSRLQKFSINVNCYSIQTKQNEMKIEGEKYTIIKYEML